MGTMVMMMMMDQDGFVQEGVRAGLPGGVEEGVSCDAVSRCRRGNEPESRSAASIRLPLEAVVAVQVE